MKPLAGAAALSLFLAMPASVMALATSTSGNAPVPRQPGWAEGIVDVVNLKSRVYSYWVNGNERFFYRGGAPALNEALRKFAAVKDDVRQLILLPGPASTNAFRSQPIPFDWELHVPSGIYKAVSRRTQAVMTVYIRARRPRPLRNPRQVEQWLRDLDSDSFQTRDKAHRALQKLGSDAKPLLRKALQGQPMPETRHRIERLADQLPDFDVTDLDIPRGLNVLTTDDLLAQSLKGLKDKSPTVSAMAVQDLMVLAPYSDKVVPALIAMLSADQNEYIRRVAASCLAHVGAGAKSALPALEKGLKDADPNIRHAFQSARDRIKNANVTPEPAEQVQKRRAILQEIKEFQKAAKGK
jgi:hypothetical protein